MPVEIVNITPERTDKEPHGYSVRINGKEIAQFSHDRKDGASTCLRLAAAAVENAVRPRSINVTVQDTADGLLIVDGPDGWLDLIPKDRPSKVLEWFSETRCRVALPKTTNT